MYFNGVKPSYDFRLVEETPLDVLKSKLNNLVHHTNNRKVVKIEYHSPLIDNKENISFNKFELKTNEDLKVMWNIYHRYKTKCLIEVDVTIATSVNDIIKMLKRPESFSTI